ncbi:MAG TPA: hypothetical protein VMM18_07470 [Gemmatimonadaceae bacterium]|nr:hypothetical protein [Gemmatimonadaceae bacterium]
MPLGPLRLPPSRVLAVDREGTMSLRAWQGEWRAIPPEVREMLDLWNEPIW